MTLIGGQIAPPAERYQVISVAARRCALFATRPSTVWRRMIGKRWATRQDRLRLAFRVRRLWKQEQVQNSARPNSQSHRYSTRLSQSVVGIRWACVVWMALSLYRNDTPPERSY